MQEILEFLLKRRYVLTFIILEIICLSLILNFNESQKDIFWYNAGLVSNSVKKRKAHFSNFMDLRVKNDSIQAENARLNAKIKAIEYFQLENFTLDSLDALKQFQYIPSRVIDNSIDKTRNFLILNRGKKDGLAVGNGVIDRNGIVGIVQDVSSEYAKVVSVLHRDFRLSAGIKDKNYFGFMYWEPYDYNHLWMTGVPKHVQLEIGEEIVTRHSRIFPENYPIGTIADFYLNPGSNYYSIKVKLASPAYNKDFVYVIQNMDDAQLDSLYKNISIE